MTTEAATQMTIAQLFATAEHYERIIAELDEQGEPTDELQAALHVMEAEIEGRQFVQAGAR